MPLAPHAAYASPDYWNIWGHSYVAGAPATLDQSGRPDAMFRAALDIEYNNYSGHGVSGSLLIMKGRSKGGWTRVFQELVPPIDRGAPYHSAGGANWFFWGINDLGILNATVQVKAAFIHALRACISRARAATLYEDTSAKHTYGAGFTVNTPTSDIGSGSSSRVATTTTAATITLTLPADYGGEPVVMCFWGQNGVVGGTITFSGTAGVTGTLSTSNIMPSATLSQCPVIKRVTNLTSANASQTIVATCTQVDAGGSVYFDCSWLESKTPPTVLVSNVNRLTTAGYAGYGGWTGTEAAKDQQVLDTNTDIVNLVSEFDSMVQIIDIDSLIGKNATTTFDGIHPNEIGSALICDAALTALKRLTPTSGGTGGPTANMNPPSPRMAQRIRPRVSGNWYSSEYTAYGASYTAVSGDMFAMPFEITEGRNRYTKFGIEAIASVTGTSVRWGVYDAIASTGYQGYPQCLMFENAGPFTITTGAGVKQSAAFTTTWIPDPGLYWLVVQFGPVGAAHTFRTITGPNACMPTQSSTGAGTISPSGWKLSGVGTGALPTTFAAGAALADPVPMLNILLS